MTDPNKAFKQRNNPRSTSVIKKYSFTKTMSLNMSCNTAGCGYWIVLPVYNGDSITPDTIPCPGCGATNWDCEVLPHEE